MSFQLDHIVIAVHDLERAIADYGELGFTVLRGGEHPGRSTHNALVVFTDGAYFELIAWKAPAPQERWWQLLQRHGEGIVDFALLPRDTAGAVAEAGRRGLALDGPQDGGRLRPDGQQLRWQTARPASGDLPFLCGDLTPRALRVPDGDARRHANGAISVASLALAVHDIDVSLARWRALLGAAAAHVGQPLSLLGGSVRLAVVELGSSALVLSAPREHRDGAVGEARRQRLATRGEGPYALVLRTANPAAAGALLALDATHGASIELEPPPGAAPGE